MIRTESTTDSVQSLPGERRTRLQPLLACSSRPATTGGAVDSDRRRVHTGRSFVGTVGEGDARDFTALGDTVNTAARLTSLAEAGEILVSAEGATAGGLETTGLERRTLELRGREQNVDAWVARAART
jgi:class 3 adenylate cyclase